MLKPRRSTRNKVQTDFLNYEKLGQDTKFLGVTIDNQLSWILHINNLYKWYLNQGKSPI